MSSLKALLSPRNLSRQTRAGPAVERATPPKAVENDEDDDEEDDDDDEYTPLPRAHSAVTWRATKQDLSFDPTDSLDALLLNALKLNKLGIGATAAEEEATTATPSAPSATTASADAPRREKASSPSRPAAPQQRRASRPTGARVGSKSYTEAEMAQHLRSKAKKKKKKKTVAAIAEEPEAEAAAAAAAAVDASAASIRAALANSTSSSSILELRRRLDDEPSIPLPPTPPRKSSEPVAALGELPAAPAAAAAADDNDYSTAPSLSGSTGARSALETSWCASSDAAPLNVRRETRAHWRRRMVLRELAATEATFVELLERLKEELYAPLTRAAPSAAGNLGPVDALHARHAALLVDVRAAVDADDALGVARRLARFADAAETRRLYVAYAKQCSLPALLHSAASMPRVQHVLDAANVASPHALQSYLIAPVQRICRYPLLLGELHDATRDAGALDAADDVTLRAAVECAQLLAAATNQSQQSRALLERFVRTTVTSPHDAAARVLADERRVLVRRSTAAEMRDDRWLVLCNDALLVGKARTLLKLLPLSHYMLADETVRFRSDAARDAWQHELHALLLIGQQHAQDEAAAAAAPARATATSHASGALAGDARRSVSELVFTWLDDETAYVERDLDAALVRFRAPLLDYALLSAADADALFRNLPRLAAHHRRTLDALRRALAAAPPRPAALARALVLVLRDDAALTVAAYAPLHLEYARSAPDAHRLYDALVAADAPVRDFLLSTTDDASRGSLRQLLRVPLRRPLRWLRWLDQILDAGDVELGDGDGGGHYDDVELRAALVGLRSVRDDVAALIERRFGEENRRAAEFVARNVSKVPAALRIGSPQLRQFVSDGDVLVNGALTRLFLFSDVLLLAKPKRSLMATVLTMRSKLSERLPSSSSSAAPPTQSARSSGGGSQRDADDDDAQAPPAASSSHQRYVCTAAIEFSDERSEFVVVHPLADTLQRANAFELVHGARGAEKPTAYEVTTSSAAAKKLWVDAIRAQLDVVAAQQHRAAVQRSSRAPRKKAIVKRGKSRDKLAAARK